MDQYTLLFHDPKRAQLVRAVTFDAETADRAIELVRILAVPERCELWSDEGYVCSLAVYSGLGRKWVAVTRDEPVAGSLSSTQSASPQSVF